MLRTPCWVETSVAGRIVVTAGIGASAMFADFLSKGPRETLSQKEQYGPFPISVTAVLASVQVYQASYRQKVGHY